MRKQFVNTMEDVIMHDKNAVLLLGDIGVFGFRNAFAKYPDRIFNIGILEQSTISMAAGLSVTGLIPTVHTIAPFLVERCFEQVKDDFGYQQLGGNFVSVGASYDYTALGCTHHCPADVNILKQIPEMEIILPGTAQEFDMLFKEVYANGHPTYFRLSERSNGASYPVSFGKAHVVKKGTRGTVVVVGSALSVALSACENLDVSILYYTTVAPFDADTLQKHSHGNIALIEPYYEGGLAYDISKALTSRPFQLECIGVPHRFLTNYGTVNEHDENICFTSAHITRRLASFFS